MSPMVTALESSVAPRCNTSRHMRFVMTRTLDARVVAGEEDDDCWRVEFADDEFNGCLARIFAGAGCFEDRRGA